MPNTAPRYDNIGRSYTATRREDPRIAAQIHAALGPGAVVNIGAGTGSYEPANRHVTAVEPSTAMIRQRVGRSTSVVRAVAESLPFADDSFDVAMAVLTLHHWTDPVTGLCEMARVAARQVILFFEPLRTHTFWAIDYFPTALSLPTEQNTPAEAVLRSTLNVRDVVTVPVPNDCVDGFGVAFWARPEAYLDPAVQAGMSWLAMLPDADRRQGSERLQADLDSGEWDRRLGHLRTEDTFDGGYRIAIAERP